MNDILVLVLIGMIAILIVMLVSTCYACNKRFNYYSQTKRVSDLKYQCCPNGDTCILTEKFSKLFADAVYDYGYHHSQKRKLLGEIVGLLDMVGTEDLSLRYFDNTMVILFCEYFKRPTLSDAVRVWYHIMDDIIHDNDFDTDIIVNVDSIKQQLDIK